MAGKVYDQCYVTLAATDEYGLGAIVLAHSLKESGTQRMLVCMVTDRVSAHVRGQLEGVFDEVVAVDELNSHDSVNLALLCRPELGITFTKIFAWRLTKYTKAVFMDADTLVIKNIDDAFEREELSAAPDVGWPDCFNSGVFVFVPSMETFQKLVQFAQTEGSFDGGDQGLLNAYFGDWATADIKRHLPFVYNLNANATYFYAPAYKQYGHLTRVVHFIGAGKPWHWARDAQGNVLVDPEAVPHSIEHIRMWWATLDRHVRNFAPKSYGIKSVGTGNFSTQWQGGVAVHSAAGAGRSGATESASGFAAIQNRLDTLIGSQPAGYKYPDVTDGSGAKLIASADEKIAAVAQKVADDAEASEVVAPKRKN